jgi:hypothetical protein
MGLQVETCSGSWNSAVRFDYTQMIVMELLQSDLIGVQRSEVGCNAFRHCRVVILSAAFQQSPHIVPRISRSLHDYAAGK